MFPFKNNIHLFCQFYPTTPFIMLTWKAMLTVIRLWQRKSVLSNTCTSPLLSGFFQKDYTPSVLAAMSSGIWEKMCLRGWPLAHSLLSSPSQSKGLRVDIRNPGGWQNRWLEAQFSNHHGKDQSANTLLDQDMQETKFLLYQPTEIWRLFGTASNLF